MKKCIILSAAFILISVQTFNGQSLVDLERLPVLQAADLEQIPGIPSDTLKPIYYGGEFPGNAYITEPSENLKLLGCRGDFDNDGTADYSLYIRDTRNNQDRLMAYITGKDKMYPLNDWHKALNIVAEENPYSRGLSTVKCRKMPKTREVTILYGKKIPMKGDMITYGWYSYLWNGENGFREILTSD